MLKHNAKALHYLKPGQIIGMKVGDEWAQFTLLDVDKTEYRDSSFVWIMANKDSETITRPLPPVVEWVVLCVIDYLLDLGEPDTKVPNFKQQGSTLGAFCDVCNDGTIKLFAEEEQHLINKLPFACLQAGRISSIQLKLAKEDTMLPTPRPGFPVLQDMEDEANENAK